MSNNVYIGFDFSINKPAATIYSNGHYYFYFWALNTTEKNILRYRRCEVNAMSRGLESIKLAKPRKKKAENGMKRKRTPKAQGAPKINNSAIVLLHTIRSVELANLIVADLDFLIRNTIGLKEDFNLYVSSEGLSFGSKGNEVTDLATYKGVLLAKIYEHYGDNLKRMFTYPPITMKSVAGCSKCKDLTDKMPMITAFIKEGVNHPFSRALIDGSLVAEVNFIPGVDDLCDSYWALKTMFVKEKLRDE